MLNAWLEVARLMPMWSDVNRLTSDDIRRIDSDLRGFISESVGDHFSSIFFSSNFDKLPGIERKIDIFRAKLNDLDRTINAIPPGNTEVFKGLWGTITTQFNDLRNMAQEISRLADDIQGSLIHELRDAAQQ
jgi:hypothetical protein